MTIQEALKSGKKFRRRNWAEKSFLAYDPFDQRLIFYNGGVIMETEDSISPLEVLAEDWETIEDEYELNTKQQITRDLAKRMIEKSGIK